MAEGQEEGTIKSQSLTPADGNFDICIPRDPLSVTYHSLCARMFLFFFFFFPLQRPASS